VEQLLSQLFFGLPGCFVSNKASFKRE
jgi:hypothetical protein